MNQWCNKSVSKFRSQFDAVTQLLKQLKLKDKIFNMSQKRKYFVKDYLHKVSFQIEHYCVSNRIYNILVGHNKSWK